ncbi:MULTISPECIES: hypothetical protein [unclassified Romboutsia]|nr:MULTISPECIES: hypothetical protein [unclassified Romboutsia]SCI41308.1 Uncharacterised protein [uncultured Clostridium sp.]
MKFSTRSILFIMDDRAHYKFFSENAYDKTDKTPFNKLEEFFYQI